MIMNDEVPNGEERNISVFAEASVNSSKENLFQATPTDLDDMKAENKIKFRDSHNDESSGSSLSDWYKADMTVQEQDASHSSIHSQETVKLDAQSSDDDYLDDWFGDSSAHVDNLQRAGSETIISAERCSESANVPRLVFQDFDVESISVNDDASLNVYHESLIELGPPFDASEIKSVN